jgi:hypothetical protein
VVPRKFEKMENSQKKVRKIENRASRAARYFCYKSNEMYFNIVAPNLQKNKIFKVPPFLLFSTDLIFFFHFFEKFIQVNCFYSFFLHMCVKFQIDQLINVEVRK